MESDEDEEWDEILGGNDVAPQDSASEQRADVVIDINPEEYPTTPVPLPLKPIEITLSSNKKQREEKRYKLYHS